MWFLESRSQSEHSQQHPTQVVSHLLPTHLTTELNLNPHQALECSKQIKSNLVRYEGVDERRHREPGRAQDEDLALPVNVGHSAPEEHEAAEGERVRGYYPLEPCLGDLEVSAYGREDDDHGLPGQALLFWSAPDTPEAMS